MNDGVVEYPAVTELLTLGNEYCYFVENQSKYDEVYRLAFLQRALSALYLKGSLLPELESCDVGFMQRYVTEENYEILFNEMRELFGKNDKYHSADSVTGDLIEHSLSENLTDLYQDMKDLFITFTKGFDAGRQCAAFYSKKWFSERWGNAIVKAMPLIHELMTGVEKSGEME